MVLGSLNLLVDGGVDGKRSSLFDGVLCVLGSLLRIRPFLLCVVHMLLRLALRRHGLLVVFLGLIRLRLRGRNTFRLLVHFSFGVLQVVAHLLDLRPHQVVLILCLPLTSISILVLHVVGVERGFVLHLWVRVLERGLRRNGIRVVGVVRRKRWAEEFLIRLGVQLWDDPTVCDERRSWRCAQCHKADGGNGLHSAQKRRKWPNILFDT
mmetsp:Transcript_16294/g.44240  ORF Transcript_16294/g.44240 Transcript_16294/m.44240 type:complete len:209 (-) Transcript_16294:2-628(-)